MNFASFPYLLFLLLSILVYFALPAKPRAVFLLLASYFFYAIFGFGFALLMFFTTSVTFISSHYCYHARLRSHRKLFFFIGLLVDLAVFILFKYIHIIDIDLMNWPNWSVEKLLIPVGISFYTFKTIGYCVDIYRRKYAPEPSFLYYALSVSFFPQLIAGPIEKAIAVSNQLKHKSDLSIPNCIEGGKLILWGLFKKIVIADSIGQIINPVFSNITAYHGLDLIVAFFAFTYQVYTDFSGYSDIAIGSAKCFGIKLPANFDKPFFSKNFFEFWKRWHITLYAWVKEYIYDYMLGGIDRESKLKTTLKVALIFLLIGLWHGATLNYLFYVETAFIWVLLDFFTKEYRRKLYLKLHIANDGFIIRCISYLAIIGMVSSFEIFFKGNTLGYSFYIIKNIFSFQTPVLTLFQLIVLASVIIFFEFLQFFQRTPTGHCFEGMKNFYMRLLTCTALLFMLVLLSSRPEIKFQYFQF